MDAMAPRLLALSNATWRQQMQGVENQQFQPHPYCVVCEHMCWDEQNEACSNFGKGVCPLQITQVLEKLKLVCMVL